MGSERILPPDSMGMLSSLCLLDFLGLLWSRLLALFAVRALLALLAVLASPAMLAAFFYV